MTSEDFSLWLLAISGMSAAQRAEALAALEKAGADADPSTKTRGKRTEDALGTTGVERVERQGCPHCASREIVGWGRSDGLLRFRCKACGRTFNALTKTPMAHLRKKEKWLDHARAMIEGKSLAKTAQLCGVHPTTAFRWRHRFLRAPAVNKPRSLSGVVEADETFVLESFKGRWSDLPRKAWKAGRNRPTSGALSGQYPRSRRPRPEGRDVGRRSAAGRLGFDRSSPCRRRHAGQPFDRRRRPANRRFRPQSRDSGPRPMLAPGKPAAEAPHLHLNNVNAYHSRLKQWLSRFNSVATKNLPNYLRWRRALEAWGDQLDPPNWIMGAIGTAPYQTDNAIRATRELKELRASVRLAWGPADRRAAGPCEGARWTNRRA